MSLLQDGLIIPGGPRGGGPAQPSYPGELGGDEDDTVGRELRLREGRQDEFMHLPKVVWALIADLVAMMLFIACIPFILTIAKRRRTTSQASASSSAWPSGAQAST